MSSSAKGQSHEWRIFEQKYVASSGYYKELTETGNHEVTGNPPPPPPSPAPSGNILITPPKKEVILPLDNRFYKSFLLHKHVMVKELERKENRNITFPSLINDSTS